MSFLSLPAQVRSRIYDYGFEQHGTYEYDFSGGWPRKRIYFTPILHLLLTCRTIRDELAPRWFANGIRIRWNEEGNSQQLRKFPPKCLAALTSLTIHVSQASCIRGSRCCRDHKGGKGHDSKKHDAPLDFSSPKSAPTLKEWQITIQYLAAHVQSHLQLHLICDVANLETAKAIVHPLYSLPSLAVCDLRLAAEPDPAIRNFAFTAANQLVDPRWLPPTATFYPFLRLPQELQIEILSYTDLLAPAREVSWAPGVGFFLQYVLESCWDLGAALENGDTEGACERDHPHLHALCRFRHCIRAHGPSSYERIRRGCFCRTHHAAFTRKCHCWAPPTPLFLVSRTFSRMAQEVFFSRNQFIIMPSSEPPPHPLDALVFFQSAIPPDMRSVINQIDLIIPQIDFEINYLDLASYSFDMPSLTLRVHLQQYYRHPVNIDLSTERDKILESYAPVLRPLADLGVTRLFVLLDYAREQWHAPRESVEDLEQRLERLVLGPTYNSRDWGTARQVTQWAWRWYMFYYSRY